MPSASSTSPAVGRALDLLQYLSRKTGMVSAATMIRDLGLPRSSTYHILRVLVDRGFVVYVPESQGYVLGAAAYQLSSAYTRHEQLERLSRPVMAAIANRSGITVHLGVLHGNNTMYLLKEQPVKTKDPEPPLVTAVGVLLPAHLTANGRAILAQLHPDQVAALYARPGDFVSRTGKGPRSLAELQRSLDIERRQGFSEERELVGSGLRSAGVAISDLHNQPFAALSATWRMRILPRDVNEIVAALGTGAREISKRLQGRSQ